MYEYSRIYAILHVNACVIDMSRGKQQQTLLSERPDFGERIIVTRTHLCDQYMKKIDKEKIAAMMRESNLELRREQLMTTVNFENEAEHPLKQQLEQQKAEENDSGEKSSAS